MNKIIVVGNVSRDSVSYGLNREKPFWGGAGLNISLAASKFGLETSLLSIVGEDAVELVNKIKNDIDISLVKIHKGKTCQFHLKYTLDGSLIRIKCNFNVADYLNQHLSTITMLPSHYHICCRDPLNSQVILEELCHANFPFSLDFILSSARKQMIMAKNWIEYAEIVFVNSQEFQILKDTVEIKTIKKIIVTAGGNPISVFEYGDFIAEFLCEKKSFTDVTGAGDAFIGSFLAGQIQKKSLDVSIRSAIEFAQKTLNSRGVLDSD